MVRPQTLFAITKIIPHQINLRGRKWSLHLQFHSYPQSERWVWFDSCGNDMKGVCRGRGDRFPGERIGCYAVVWGAITGTCVYRIPVDDVLSCFWILHDQRQANEVVPKIRSNAVMISRISEGRRWWWLRSGGRHSTHHFRLPLGLDTSFALTPVTADPLWLTAQVSGGNRWVRQTLRVLWPCIHLRALIHDLNVLGGEKRNRSMSSSRPQLRELLT